MDGKNSDYHYSRATLLYGLGRPQKALKALQSAMRLHPDFPEHLVLKGMLLESVGDYGGAEEAFSAAVRLANEPNSLYSYESSTRLPCSDVIAAPCIT